MPNLGPAELILILAIALIVFGPKKLPEIGKGIGNAMREFNKARNDFMDTLHSTTDLDNDDRPSRSYSADTTAQAEANPAEKKLEYPAPLAADTADALPYGTDFVTAEGDSQPSFRTAPPEAAPVSTAAPTGALSGDRKA
jgi:sec-independent protein translocase protein TatA